MILLIDVVRRSASGVDRQPTYIDTDEYSATTIDLSALLPEAVRQLFGPITATPDYADGSVLIETPDAVQRLSMTERSTFATDTVETQRGTIVLDGDEYPDPHTVCVEVTAIPRIAYAWDVPCVTRQGVTQTFQSVDLTEDRPRQKSGELTFELNSFSVLVTEWDPCEQQPREYILDAKDLADSEHDADAALRVAEDVAEQCPEALEIIARYMAVAVDLGSADARAWLYDYLGPGDSAAQPYD